MKYIVFYVLAVFFSLTSHAQGHRNDIVGKWLNDQENAHIEIYEKNGVFFGKIVWVDAPEDLSDTGRRSTEGIMGMDIISDLVYAEGLWEHGTLYLPKKDREVNCEASLSEDKKVLTLKISKLWYTNSIKWTRL